MWAARRLSETSSEASYASSSGGPVGEGQLRGFEDLSLGDRAAKPLPAQTFRPSHEERLSTFEERQMQAVRKLPATARWPRRGPGNAAGLARAVSYRSEESAQMRDAMSSPDADTGGVYKTQRYYRSNEGLALYRRNQSPVFDDESNDETEIPEDLHFINVPLSSSSLPSGLARRRESDSSRTSSTPSASKPSFDRTKSYEMAMAELDVDSRELTEQLEVYAQTKQGRRESTLSEDVRQRVRLDPKLRVESPDGNLDMMGMSKEKEATLSRTRPSWLPPKSRGEEKKHMKEYQKMIRASVEAEKTKRDSQLRARAEKESQDHYVLEEWKAILKNYDKLIKQPKCRELWWSGIPSQLRPAVWSHAITNSLRVNKTTYEIALSRAKEHEQLVMGYIPTGDEDAEVLARNSVMKRKYAQIRKDVCATLPSLGLFSERGPLYDSLLNTLLAYDYYRQDLEYSSNTRFIAALLLVNLDECSAFIALANVLSRPLLLGLAVHNQTIVGAIFGYALTLQINRYCTMFEEALRKKSPSLAAHFEETLRIPTLRYFEPMVSSLFVPFTSVDVSSRLFDAFLFEGDAFLIRAVLGILISLEWRLYGDVNEVMETLLPKPDSQGWNLGTEDQFMETVRDAGRF